MHGKALLSGMEDVIKNSGEFLYDNVAKPIAQGIADGLDIDTDIPNLHKLSNNISLWWEQLKLWWETNVMKPFVNFFVDMAMNFLHFKADFEKNLANLRDGIVNTYNSFWNWINGVYNNLTTFFSDRLNDITSFFYNIGASIRDFVTVTLPAKWNELKKWLENITTRVINIGTNLVKGLWNGIDGATSWLKDKIKSWVNNIISSIQSFFGIQSPSKVMADQVGKYMAEGIGVGFGNTLPSVVKAMQEKLGIVTDAFQTELALGDIPQIQGNTIVSENQYITKNYTNTVETIRQPQAIDLILDGTKVARAIIPPLNSEYNRLGVKI